MFPNSHQLCTFELGQCVLVSSLAGHVQRRTGDRRSTAEGVLLALRRGSLVVIGPSVVIVPGRAGWSAIVVVVLGGRSGVSGTATTDTVSLLGRLQRRGYLPIVVIIQGLPRIEAKPILIVGLCRHVSLHGHFFFAFALALQHRNNSVFSTCCKQNSRNHFWHSTASSSRCCRWHYFVFFCFASRVEKLDSLKYSNSSKFTRSPLIYFWGVVFFCFVELRIHFEKTYDYCQVLHIFRWAQRVYTHTNTANKHPYTGKQHSRENKIFARRFNTHNIRAETAYLPFFRYYYFYFLFSLYTLKSTV